ncbi:Transcriptional repressor SdpR [Methylophilaceae bacterium]|nr:Transcriptional repressor SdpR [Methylophilaceae bacterium]
MKVITSIPGEWKNTSDLFLALGDEQRQRILLAFETGERLNISQIVAASTLSRSAVTHHLNVLKQSGALHHEKVGKEMQFWVNREVISDALQRVLGYIDTQT